MRDLYLEMRDTRSSLVTALTGADVDRQSIESLRAARMASLDQASERVLQALADVAEILTPAQRAEIAEKLARHDRYDD
jgi:Spy/CpxP family protein refolding chaperone